MGFTDHDEHIEIGGTLYEPSSGFISSDLQQSLGLSVDNADIFGALSADAIREIDLLSGLYDNATVELYKVNWSDLSKSQYYLCKTGTVGQVTRSAIHFQAEFRSLSHKLNQPQGRIYHAECDARLGDARCGVQLDLLGMRTTTTITRVISSGRFIVALSSDNVREEDWFSYGVCTFTSGAYFGQSVDIRRFYKSAYISAEDVAYASSTGSTAYAIDLWDIGHVALLARDTVTLTVGCDKSMHTCKTKFSNAINFRGFPSIPGNDMVTRYPLKDDVNEGRPLVILNTKIGI
jgi:uncharacterized phage protein (TIGR02218 family)